MPAEFSTYPQAQRESRNERRARLKVGSQETNEPVPDRSDGRRSSGTSHVCRVKEIFKSRAHSSPVDANERRRVQVLHDAQTLVQINIGTRDGYLEQDKHPTEQPRSSFHALLHKHPSADTSNSAKPKFVERHGRNGKWREGILIRDRLRLGGLQWSFSAIPLSAKRSRKRNWDVLLSQ